MRTPTLKLSTQQRQRLERQLRETQDVRLQRRTQAILLLGEGQSVAQVARTLAVARRTVHYWLADYVRDPDPAHLTDEPRPGRPSLWTRETRALLVELLDNSPLVHGHAALHWTVPLLQEQLLSATGLQFSDDTIRREMGRLGYVWNWPGYVRYPRCLPDHTDGAGQGKQMTTSQVSDKFTCWAQQEFSGDEE